VGNRNFRYKGSMIALVDCNNFYASCERLFRPSLINKPVCVLSNNDGCVIARSQEVKDLGVKMGAPAFKCKEIFDKNDVAIFSTNFPLYGDISSRVMGVLSQFTNELDVYSIDEAFLHLKMYDADYHQYGLSIRERVNRWVGIPTCVGVAETKTLAKLANHVAKKFPQLKGVHVIDTIEKRDKALKWAKVDEIWGIGRKSAEKMRYYGILTAYDFVQKSDSFVRRHFSVVGLRTKKELMGIPCFTLANQPTGKKSIMTSRTFAKYVTDIDGLNEALASYVSSCAYKLRKQSSCAQTIMVFVHTNKHRKDKPQYYNSQSMNLPVASNCSTEILGYAKELLKNIFYEGYEYNKVGVMVSNIIPQEQVQGNLFDKIDRGKHGRLMQVMDNINEYGGRGSIRLASQSYSKGLSKRESLSPEYTTKWSDILEIR